MGQAWKLNLCRHKLCTMLMIPLSCLTNQMFSSEAVSKGSWRPQFIAARESITTFCETSLHREPYLFMLLKRWWVAPNDVVGLVEIYAPHICVERFNWRPEMPLHFTYWCKHCSNSAAQNRSWYDNQAIFKYNRGSACVERRTRHPFFVLAR